MTMWVQMVVSVWVAHLVIMGLTGSSSSLLLPNIVRISTAYH